MSDVVAVGIITGSVGVISSLLAYLTGRHQASVELTKIEEEHGETRRAERQTIYRQLLTLMQERSYMVDRPGLTGDDITEFRKQMNDVESAVRILGAAEVATAVAEYEQVVTKMGDAARRIREKEPHLTFAEQTSRAWDEYADEAIAAERNVVDAMRSDVNPSYTSLSAPAAR